MAKRKYTKKKTTNRSPKKRKYTRRKKNNSLKFLFIFSLIFVLLCIITFYTIIIFPKVLQKKIKSNLVNIYSPISLQQKDDFILLKLSNKPTKVIQQKAFRSIKENYGLSLKFTKVIASTNKGINKLEFYRNNKIFSGIKRFYIYWNLTNNKIIKKHESQIQQKHSTDAKKEFIKIEEDVKVPKNTKRSSVPINNFKQNISQKTNQVSSFSKIAIIIDDVGYNYNSTYNFLTLGFPVTFAIIPNAIKSKIFYNLFSQYNYDIILHIPMEPLKGRKYVEKNAIFTNMSDKNIKNRINLFFSEYPLAIGANNHMGSKAVTDARVMKDILEVINSNHKIWIDSMTSRYSVTKEISSLLSMHYLERDVFLDNKKDYNYIKTSMNKLILEARKKGYAIGIGHIQSSNLTIVLKEYYNNRNNLHIQFVSLKEILKH